MLKFLLLRQVRCQDKVQVQQLKYDLQEANRNLKVANTALENQKSEKRCLQREARSLRNVSVMKRNKITSDSSNPSTKNLTTKALPPHKHHLHHRPQLNPDLQRMTLTLSLLVMLTSVVSIVNLMRKEMAVRACTGHDEATDRISEDTQRMTPGSCIVYAYDFLFINFEQFIHKFNSACDGWIFGILGTPSMIDYECLNSHLEELCHKSKAARYIAPPPNDKPSNVTWTVRNFVLSN